MSKVFQAIAWTLIGIAMSSLGYAQSKYPEWISTAEGLPLEVLKAGPGARGTVILAHGCGGPSQHLDAAWAKLFRDEGFNTVGFDSWQFRKISGGVCKTYAVSGDERVKEVELTVKWINEQQWHEGKIFLMGWSHGGITALAASIKENLGIAKIVAIYPRCRNWYSAPVVPTQIHIGTEDDWTPAYHCKNLYAGLFHKSRFGELFMYQGAHHIYDYAVNVDELYYGIGDQGMGNFRQKSDPEARELTIKRVMEFFKN